MFEREAKKYRLNPATLLGGDDLKKVGGRPRLRHGRRSAGRGGLRQGLARISCCNRLAPAAVRWSRRSAGRPADTRPRTEQGVRIRGVDDLLVRFAKCCNPLPGDAIVGFITRGRGLTVHARDCLTVVKSVLDRERLISVEWDVEEPATASGPDRGLHRARPSGAALRDHRRHLLPRTATSPRPRSRSPTTAGASITSWSRSPISASCKPSWAPIREVPDVASTWSASAACDRRADDNGPSPFVASVAPPCDVAGPRLSRRPSAPRIWAVLVAPAALHSRMHDHG